MAEGTKYDEGKNRLDLLPYDALWQVGEVYSFGCKKYEDRNWEEGIAYCRVFAAMMRHAWKWMLGAKDDEETGLPHLASVAWCALTLLHYDLNPSKYKSFDNRPGDHVLAWVKEK